MSTPTIFAETVAKRLEGLAEVDTHDKKMGRRERHGRNFVYCPRKYSTADHESAMNGKRISVDSADHEGRLVLCGALPSAEFEQKFVFDTTTFTYGIMAVLGDCRVGAYSTRDRLWNLLEAAG